MFRRLRLRLGTGEGTKLCKVFPWILRALNYWKFFVDSMKVGFDGMLSSRAPWKSVPVGHDQNLIISVGLYNAST